MSTASKRHAGDVVAFLLRVPVIKVQNPWIRFPAVYAGVVQKIVPDELSGFRQPLPVALSMRSFLLGGERAVSLAVMRPFTRAAPSVMLRVRLVFCAAFSASIHTANVAVSFEKSIAFRICPQRLERRGPTKAAFRGSTPRGGSNIDPGPERTGTKLLTWPLWVRILPGLR